MRAAVVMLAISLLAGCGKVTPVPVSDGTPPFTVISEQKDPPAGGLTVNIRIDSPVTEAEIKSIAEGVIASRSRENPTVTVRTYLGGSAAAAAPFAESRLRGGSITHRLNTQVGSQKIPTH